MKFSDLIDLASERFGGTVLFANDDFFASKDNLLKPTAPVFIDGKYTERGKWMDGWESRRRRTPGYDWCLIRLGFPGIVHGIVVDTSFFRGNYPEQCSIDAAAFNPLTTVDELIGSESRWTEILAPSNLKGDTQKSFRVRAGQRFTHLRLKIYPDGGVARLRVFGEVVPDWEQVCLQGRIDLAAIEHGARVLSSSDMFFGHRHNLIMPGRALNMSDGWETKRRRGPGHDWVIIKLGRPGEIEAVEVDTSWFKGNFPESCSLEVANLAKGEEVEGAAWKPLLGNTRLQAHTRHLFQEVLLPSGLVSHVRFNIFPDGGVSRLRIYGRPSRLEIR